MSERIAAKIRTPVILGPTAAGKTDFAIKIAQNLGVDIISCDSRQIYRSMDIGTAKPSRAQRNAVNHELIDIIDPSEPYSAYQFATDAGTLIRNKAKDGGGSLICGGTGLYFRALSQGLGPQLASDNFFRTKLEKRVASEGPESIFKELEQVDPVTAARVHPNDTYRIIRALQVFYQTNVPLSLHNLQAQPPDDLEFGVIVLDLPRPQLYERINKRVDQMFRRGLWDEFHELRKRGYNQLSPGMRCVGYQELFAVKQGILTLSDAVEKIKRNTRRYAKRQITWFSRQVHARHCSCVDANVDHKAMQWLSLFLEQ